jgi:hypothetical protein
MTEETRSGSRPSANDEVNSGWWPARRGMAKDPVQHRPWLGADASPLQPRTRTTAGGAKCQVQGRQRHQGRGQQWLVAGAAQPRMRPIAHRGRRDQGQ